MVLSGVEVGIQLCFINKMEWKSGLRPALSPWTWTCLWAPSWSVLFMRVSRATRAARARASPQPQPSEEPGARTKEQGVEQNVWG